MPLLPFARSVDQLMGLLGEFLNKIHSLSVFSISFQPIGDVENQQRCPKQDKRVGDLLLPKDDVNSLGRKDCLMTKTTVHQITVVHSQKPSAETTEKLYDHSIQCQNWS